MATPSDMRKALGPVLKKSDKRMKGRRYPYDLNAYTVNNKNNQDSINEINTFKTFI